MGNQLVADWNQPSIFQIEKVRFTTNCICDEEQKYETSGKLESSKKTEYRIKFHCHPKNNDDKQGARRHSCKRMLTISKCCKPVKETVKNLDDVNFVADWYNEGTM